MEQIESYRWKRRHGDASSLTYLFKGNDCLGVLGTEDDLVEKGIILRVRASYDGNWIYVVTDRRGLPQKIIREFTRENLLAEIHSFYEIY